MNSWKLNNARIVNLGRIVEGSLLIVDGRIAGTNIGSKRKVTELDCQGALVMPGIIDDQVHFREPGLTHKGGIRSESRAAVAGGVTAYMEMPNTLPPTLDADALERKCAIAAANSAANYAFYLGASNDNLTAIERLKIGQAAGIKVFMGSSTGNMLVDSLSVLEKIFARAPTLIATHCEDSRRIVEREEKWRACYGNAIPVTAHPMIRDRQACFQSSEQAVALARQHRAQLHVLHITTADECALFSTHPVEEKNITAEACVHHLSLCADDYLQLGTRIKCNPAIKTAQDRLAVIRAVSENRIDIVATDHAPHLLEEKNRSYFDAPSGMPLIQEMFPLLLELHHDQLLDITTIVDKTAHAVAHRFHIIDRGFLNEGCWADVVVVEDQHGYRVQNRDALSKCGWTPFDGRWLRSRVKHTFVNGQMAYNDGVIDDTVRGMRLQFGIQR